MSETIEQQTIDYIQMIEDKLVEASNERSEALVALSSVSVQLEEAVDLLKLFKLMLNEDSDFTVVRKDREPFDLVEVTVIKTLFAAADEAIEAWDA